MESPDIPEERPDEYESLLSLTTEKNCPGSIILL